MVLGVLLIDFGKSLTYQNGLFEFNAGMILYRVKFLLCLFCLF